MLREPIKQYIGRLSERKRPICNCWFKVKSDKPLFKCSILKQLNGQED